jgi:hypothetical protein
MIGLWFLAASFQFLVRANLNPRNATETQNQKAKNREPSYFRI